MHVDLVCLLFLHASAENGCSLASCLNADMVSHILHAGKKVSLAAVGKWFSVADLEHSLALWACLGVIVTGASHAAVTLLAWQPVTLSLTWTDCFCGTG